MKEFLWSEKYRPKTIEDVILPDHYKSQFSAMVKKKEIPNLILSGSHGIGKTTVAKALCEEIGATVFFINGSVDGVKDTLRNEIKDFSTTLSFDGKRKIVILDEADSMSSSMQRGLRSFMETHSKNVSFILTCNYPNDILPELHSRCAHIEFTFSKADKKKMAREMYKSLQKILELENIEFDKIVLAQFVKKKFPDMRNMLVNLQKHAAKGRIDQGLLITLIDKSIKRAISAMMEKSVDKIIQWVNETEHDDNSVFTYLYDHAINLMADDESAANLILTLGKYQDMAHRAANKNINLAAALTEIAFSVEWKKET